MSAKVAVYDSLGAKVAVSADLPDLSSTTIKGGGGLVGGTNYSIQIRKTTKLGNLIGVKNELNDLKRCF